MIFFTVSFSRFAPPSRKINPQNKKKKRHVRILSPMVGYPLSKVLLKLWVLVFAEIKVKEHGQSQCGRLDGSDWAIDANRKPFLKNNMTRHQIPCVSKQCPADGVWRIGRGGSPDRVLKTRFTPSESSAGHGLPPQRAPKQCPANGVRRIL